MSKEVACNECGAGLPSGSDDCPLCGAEVASKVKAKREPRRSATADEYQSSVRSLREQLKKLRDGGAGAA